MDKAQRGGSVFVCINTKWVFAHTQYSAVECAYEYSFVLYVGILSIGAGGAASPLRHQGADCRGLRALGRLAAQNSLPGLRFACGTLCLTPAIRYTDLGALPAASGFSVPETASRAGIHLLGLALTRSPPRYAWLSPGSRQNADARPNSGRKRGFAPI